MAIETSPVLGRHVNLYTALRSTQTKRTAGPDLSDASVAACREAIEARPAKPTLSWAIGWIKSGVRRSYDADSLHDTLHERVTDEMLKRGIDPDMLGRGGQSMRDQFVESAVECVTGGDFDPYQAAEHVVGNWFAFPEADEHGGS